MEISRSGYYRWLRRRENKTQRQETKETLKMLIKNYHTIHPERGYGDDHTILHSDQGIVYSSKKFEKAHKDFPISRSMSRAGTPTDNPVIESLIGWIKGDLKHYIKIHDFKDIYNAIELYIDYFNHHRVAYRLDYLTPVEYRTINRFT